MLLSLAYGGLAALALWATWRDFDLRWIGLWLIAGWILSNALFVTLGPEIRPGPYTLMEMMVALATFCAWAEHRYRALIGVVLANLVSIGANVAFATITDPIHRQIWLFEVTTNICFAVECLLTASVGIAHGLRTGRFDSWTRFRRRAPESHAARESREP